MPIPLGPSQSVIVPSLAIAKFYLDRLRLVCLRCTTEFCPMPFLTGETMDAKLTAVQAVEILRKHGTEVTTEEAEKILEF